MRRLICWLFGNTDPRIMEVGITNEFWECRDCHIKWEERPRITI